MKSSWREEEEGTLKKKKKQPNDAEADVKKREKWSGGSRAGGSPKKGAIVNRTVTSGETAVTRTSSQTAAHL